jgi:hypothetical protein
MSMDSVDKRGPIDTGLKKQRLVFAISVTINKIINENKNQPE